MLLFDGFDCCDTPEAKGDGDSRASGAARHAIHYMRCRRVVLQKITHHSAGVVGALPACYCYPTAVVESRCQRLLGLSLYDSAAIL